MDMTNQEMLARMQAAFKNIVDVDSLGKSVLQPAKFSRFVRMMQHKTVVLNEARFIEMDSDVVDIDRVGFVGRILRSGTKLNPVTGKYEHRTIKAGEETKPAFATNKLTAKELQAVTGIKDKALRRNIERGNFEATLVDLFGEAAGRDLEEFAILADTDISYGDDDVLSLTDGWIKLAGNKIYGKGTGKDFDATSKAWPENMFDAMMAAMPKQYLRNEGEFRFYVDWEVRKAYIKLLKKRNTNLGDRAYVQSGEMVPPYEGIPVRYVPAFNRSRSAEEGAAGKVALLSHPNNMAWGIFHTISIEPDRIPRDRRTDFVLSFEGDAGYEDEDGAVAAFIQKEKPSS